jgi:hypothetical protein
MHVNNVRTRDARNNRSFPECTASWRFRAGTRLEDFDRNLSPELQMGCGPNNAQRALTYDALESQVVAEQIAWFQVGYPIEPGVGKIEW